ncbi:LuxR C-terminal-related transcriptional regulator [Sandaracinus amylolyticus]|uniref:LuxR C-terminal-related transcriptional regulator n=1 Tax=Sandaracinus amylolyticus TaxID=927083 RepID=UPI001F39DEE9|nr:response regulator transcription factor [Sandaracinus amylolyticus]UJR83120.1 Hypothetical protein I5071_51860 [Sandaracinus amylolyticus]
MDALLVEDHTLVREGLRMMLESTGRFAQCHECASLAAGLDAARTIGPALGLVLLDPGLPDADGLGGLERFLKAVPDVPVVVVSGGDDASFIDAAFARGARGYVPKSSSAPALRAAIDMVLRGELYVPPHVLPSRSRAPRAVPTDAPVARLTPRQADVLVLLARGLSNKEIADALQMSASTVRVHVSAILKLLGAENRTQAATSHTAQVLLGANDSRR